jgi:hypothetical protein
MNLSEKIEKYKPIFFEKLPVFLYSLTVLIVLGQLYEIYYLYTYTYPKWGYNPYLYSFYILVTVYAYATSLSTKFIKKPDDKITQMRIAYALLAVILFGMFANMSNELISMFVLDAADPKKLSKIPPDILESAIRLTTFYLPVIFLVGLTSLIRTMTTNTIGVKGIQDLKISFYKSPGELTGPLTCEVMLCMDVDKNAPVMVPESKRFEAMLIQGATGTGKTSTLLQPMGCMDIERKYFFREKSKELGYSALGKGYAYIEAPLSNQELNRTFSLRYLKPVKGKESLFEAEVKDMLKYKDEETGEYYYRDLGLCAVEPDGSYAGVLQTVAKNYSIDCVIVDPMHEDSVGINPFIGQSPSKVASIISTVLKGMYESEGSGDSSAFFGQVTQQALENLSILLKVMYPRMHGGLLPTMEDMLEMLYNYDIVEMMCEELKKDPEIYREYKILVGYFEKNFYKPHLNDRGLPIQGSVGSGRKGTEQFLYGATTQLDNLLRQKDVKRVLCARTNNVDFDDVLDTGKILTACSRRGALSSVLSKAFGMFFILALQDAVLRRPGSENTRTPFFLYIDEFPDYVNKETETCFTLFRKYRCGMVVAIQNLSQLERTQAMQYYKKVVIANTKTKVIFGDTNVEDSEYWKEIFGKSKQWKEKVVGHEDDKQWKVQIQNETDDVFDEGDIKKQAFKRIRYLTKNPKGDTIMGSGKTDFINKKYLEEHPAKFYDFTKFGAVSGYANVNGDNGTDFGTISTTFVEVEPDENAEEIKKEITVEPIEDAIKQQEPEIKKDAPIEVELDHVEVEDDFSIEFGNDMFRSAFTAPDTPQASVIDEEEKTENPNVLDKSGKIVIEVKEK